MNRLIDLPPDRLTPEQAAIFERLTAGRGRILGPYKIWIHAPAVADGMEQIGTYLNKHSSLSKREVETAIIMIAQHWDSPYVRFAHVRDGKAAGLTEAQIDALLSGGDPGFTDPHERAMHRLAAAAIARKNLPDADFAEVETVLGRAGIAEVLVLLGYYSAVAMGMRAHDVPVPAS